MREVGCCRRLQNKDMPRGGVLSSLTRPGGFCCSRGPKFKWVRVPVFGPVLSSEVARARKMGAATGFSNRGIGGPFGPKFVREKLLFLPMVLAELTEAVTVQFDRKESRKPEVHTDEPHCSRVVECRWERGRPAATQSTIRELSLLGCS